MSLEFEYFYGSDTEQFSFYCISKILFKDKLFKEVSQKAGKLLSELDTVKGIGVNERGYEYRIVI